jgi:ATP synthase protein I
MTDEPEHVPDGGGRGEGVVWSVLGTLLAGPALYGLAGYGVDRWAGTSFATPIGILVGFALGIYIVYMRYGRD